MVAVSLHLYRSVVLWFRFSSFTWSILPHLPEISSFVFFVFNSLIAFSVRKTIFFLSLYWQLRNYFHDKGWTDLLMFTSVKYEPTWLKTRTLYKSNMYNIERSVLTSWYCLLIWKFKRSDKNLFFRYTNLL